MISRKLQAEVAISLDFVMLRIMQVCKGLGQGFLAHQPFCFPLSFVFVCLFVLVVVCLSLGHGQQPRQTRRWCSCLVFCFKHAQGCMSCIPMSSPCVVCLCVLCVCVCQVDECSCMKMNWGFVLLLFWLGTCVNFASRLGDKQVGEVVEGVCVCVCVCGCVRVCVCG